MKAASIGESYAVEIRQRSIKVTVSGEYERKTLLRKVAEENILKTGFKSLLENQFTPVIIESPTGEVQTYFDKEIRSQASSLWKAAKAVAPEIDGIYVPKKISPKGEITLMHVRTLVNRLGFGHCTDIVEGYLPAFDDKGRPYKASDPKRFELKPNGAKIECFEVTFGCSIIDVEKTFIDYLADGLFLDSYCPASGCIVYISTTLNNND